MGWLGGRRETERRGVCVCVDVDVCMCDEIWVGWGKR